MLQRKLSTFILPVLSWLERKNIDFSIPYTTSSQVVIVRNNDVKASGSSFADKFKSDFIDDARYQYLLTGLRNTLIIAHWKYRHQYHTPCHCCNIHKVQSKR